MMPEGGASLERGMNRSLEKGVMGSRENGFAFLEQPGSRWPDADGAYSSSDGFFLLHPLKTHFSSSCNRPSTREHGAERMQVT